MREPRTAFEASIDKRDAMNSAEAAGHVADNMDVRMALMARVRGEEITLEAAQSEIKKIQRGTKAKGLMTRAQAFSRG